MKGNITRRGKNSWHLKFDADRDEKTRERRTQFVTVGVTHWEAAGDISARTAARYRELAENQIVPHIGAKLSKRTTCEFKAKESSKGLCRVDDGIHLDVAIDGLTINELAEAASKLLSNEEPS